MIEAPRLYLFVGTVYVFASLMGPSHKALAAGNQNFSDAISLMSEERWAAARDKAIQSGDPTLARLYEWMLYRQDDIMGLPFDRVAGFIRAYPDWPEIAKIRATAERVMPSDYPDASTLAWFKAYPPVTGRGYLQLLNALSRTTDASAYSSILVSAWPPLKADTNEQDTILESIGTRIPLTTQHERLDRLLHNQQYTLARSLAQFMGRGYPELIEARIALIEDKAGVSQLVAHVPAALYNNAGFILDRVRWREDRDDDKGAVALLNELPTSAQNNMTYPEDWWKERHVLTRRLLEQRDIRGAYSLVSNHYLKQGPEFAEAEWFSGWLALRFLNQPNDALKHFIHMYGNVKTSISKARAAYWAGRAAEKSSEARGSATTWFEQAALYPHTYYGQLALRHLGRNTVAPIAASATAEDYAAIARSPLAQATLKLRETSFDNISTLFLNATLTKTENSGEFMALGNLLARENDISGTYRIAKSASWKNIILGSYYTPSLLKIMPSVDTDKALLHGIIRQESQFDTNATSPSGALGLAQLMPATAKEVAEQNGLDYSKSWLTERPSYNIRLGSAYIDKLLKRFGGSYPLAIAAYNAGPRRVGEWLEEYGDPRLGKVDWIDWLEMIPVAETRNYVQRVTEGVVLYREVNGMR